MIELVTWRDANFSLEDGEDPDDYLCESVGWVSEVGRWLRIESERTPDGPRGITRVPLENVCTRLVLA